MQTFNPGKDAKVTFALVGEVSALRRRILDAGEAVLSDWAVVDLPASGTQTVDVTVLGALNILTPPAVRDLRLVELEVTTDAGTLTQTETFLIQGSTALQFGINTFLTYPKATLAALDFTDTGLAGWSGTPDRAQHEAALIEAHDRICLLPIIVEYDNTQSIVRYIGNDPPRLRNMTPAQIQNLDYRMLKALGQAQLVEADRILASDPLEQARMRYGLTQMTVGDSSQQFLQAKPTDLIVCERALRYIARWVRFSARVMRG